MSNVTNNFTENYFTSTEMILPREDFTVVLFLFSIKC